MKKKIVVIGSNFAGLTAAVKLKNDLGDEHEIIVLSKEEKFLFLPSLIWLPFGLRSAEDITFPLEPIYQKWPRSRPTISPRPSGEKSSFSLRPARSTPNAYWTRETMGSS